MSFLTFSMKDSSFFLPPEFTQLTSLKPALDFPIRVIIFTNSLKYFGIFLYIGLAPVHSQEPYRCQHGCSPIADRERVFLCKSFKQDSRLVIDISCCLLHLFHNFTDFRMAQHFEAVRLLDFQRLETLP